MSTFPPPVAHPAVPVPAASLPTSPQGLSLMARQLIGVAGFALLAIGSLLPWASIQTVFGNVGVAGTNGDGKLTIGLALVGGLGLLLASSRGWRVVSLIAALAAAAVVAYDWANLSSKASAVSNEYATATVGVGLYVCLIGALAAVVGSILVLKHREDARLTARGRR